VHSQSEARSALPECRVPGPTSAQAPPTTADNGTCGLVTYSVVRVGSETAQAWPQAQAWGNSFFHWHTVSALLAKFHLPGSSPGRRLQKILSPTLGPTGSGLGSSPDPGQHWSHNNNSANSSLDAHPEIHDHAILTAFLGRLRLADATQLNQQDWNKTL
jgi:hypothetical protein